jgi:predicted small lipoprotein YifL
MSIDPGESRRSIRGHRCRGVVYLAIQSRQDRQSRQEGLRLAIFAVDLKFSSSPSPPPGPCQRSSEWTITRFPRLPRLGGNFGYIAAGARSLFVNLAESTEFAQPLSRRRRSGIGPGVGLGVALVLVAALAGCGRAGPLEPPPDPNAVAKPADSDPTHTQVRHKPPPIKPPNAPFFLDPLL